MFHLKESFAKIARSTPAIATTLALAAIPIVGMIVSHEREGVRYATMTRDPIVVLHGSVSTGFLSTLGGLLWAAAVGACAVSAFRRDFDRDVRRFFLFGGALTAWLMADDVFLFHERVLPIYFGIEESYVHAAYPILCAAFLVSSRKTILAGDWPMLGAALSFFAVSEICDALIGEDSDVFYLIEDGAKFLGIALWLAYFVRSGAERSGAASAATPESP